MRLNNETKKLIIDCWNDRNLGCHGWIKSGEMWLTIEPETDECGDYIFVTLTDKIDSLGYCYGKTFDSMIFDNDDINKLNCLNDAASDTMKALQDRFDTRLFPDRYYK